MDNLIKTTNITVTKQTKTMTSDLDKIKPKPKSKPVLKNGKITDYESFKPICKKIIKNQRLIREYVKNDPSYFKPKSKKIRLNGKK
jgi:hypothetical protein